MKDVNLKELNLDKEKTTEFKKRKIFSWALFKEAIKSNWIGQVVVSVANALVIIVVVMILSTLNLNSTKTAVQNMMSNSNMEQTLKQGAIGYYSSFNMSSNIYIQLKDGQDAIVSNVSLIYDQISNTKLTSMLPLLNSTYDTNYNQTNNHENAKQNTINLIKLLLQTQLSEEELNSLSEVINIYLDNYSQNKEIDNIENLTLSISKYFVIMTENLGYEIDNEEYVTNLIYENLNKFLTALENTNEDEVNNLKTDYAYNLSFDLINNFVGQDYKDYVSLITSNMKQAYDENKNDYINNTNNYKSNAIKDGVVEMISTFLDSFMYYNYLPSYTVNIITNDFGYPIYYKNVEGQYDSNGNPIKEEVQINEYNPDLFIYLADGMGTSSNLLEKMHKEIITGVSYTKEEINKAKEDCKDEKELMMKELNIFLDLFINVDENNQNQFFDGNKIIESEIISYSINKIEATAKKQVLEEYNKQNNTTLTDINQITAENYVMSGKEMMIMVKNYVTSGIYSFISLNNDYQLQGYSMQDSMLAAMTQASNTLISSLPSDVDTTLTEIANLNTYGLIMGVVVFGMAALLLPLVYTIILANGLVSDKVETGSLAFILSTPTRRSTFVITQAIYLLFSIFTMGVIMYLGGLAARGIGIAIGGTDLISSLSILDLTLYSLGSIGVMFAISGICFLSSCIFNKTKFAIGCGGGINIFFYICSILGLFGSPALPSTIRIDAMNVFNYITILSLNDGLAVMNANYSSFFIKFVFLIIITIVCYISGVYVFSKKDLPL